MVYIYGLGSSSMNELGFSTFTNSQINRFINRENGSCIVKSLKKYFVVF